MGLDAGGAEPTGEAVEATVTGDVVPLANASALDAVHDRAVKVRKSSALVGGSEEVEVWATYLQAVK